LKNFDVSTEFQAVSDRQTDGQTLWQQILHLCAGKNNVLSLSLSLSATCWSQGQTQSNNSGTC